jgi:hypothetical protein
VLPCSPARRKPLIRNFIEYSATRPYLARLVTVESSTRTDRLEYLYHQYFLLTSGGTAPYGQNGLVSLMNPEMGATDQVHVRIYAENVAEILLSGLSLPG